MKTNVVSVYPQNLQQFPSSQRHNPAQEREFVSLVLNFH